MMVLRYLAACLKYGPQMDSYRTHPDILGVHEASLRVGREAHRFLGWLRFSEIQGVLYAVYEPEADLTCLIMPHFADRFRKERFVIHDLGRKKAGVYANGYWEEQELKQDLRPYKSSEELHMGKSLAGLFRSYCNQGAGKSKIAATVHAGENLEKPNGTGYSTGS